MMSTLGHDLEGRRFTLAQAAESGDLNAVSYSCRKPREATAGCHSLYAVFFGRCL
jgi:hypothetical protein